MQSCEHIYDLVVLLSNDSTALNKLRALSSIGNKSVPSFEGANDTLPALLELRLRSGPPTILKVLHHIMFYALSRHPRQVNP